MRLLDDLCLHWRFRFWGPWRYDQHPGFYLSHSQFGEDMLVRVLLGEKRNGFYVDLGAHHPVYLSNTHWLYRHGWTGLNVDAAPGAMEPFRVLRPRDVNIQACLGERDGEEVTFRVYPQTALSNTVGVALSPEAIPSAELQMKTLSLASLFKRYLPRGQLIDLMSIDLEGSDAAALRGNNWIEYRPTFVLVEQHGPLEAALHSESIQLLRSQGYELVGKLGPSYLLGPP
jgi:hypothetical protein